jgi:predicted house-cleaning noncanonical NTP pyrophosphatase (MazG superfamily)
MLNRKDDTASFENRKETKISYPQRLVRDRIPEIIESLGNMVIWERLDDEAYAKALLVTIVRSSEQFADTGSLEALADIMDCIDSWLDVQGLSMDEVNRARVERQKRCGNYDGRRLLVHVSEGDNPSAVTVREPRC